MFLAKETIRAAIVRAFVINFFARVVGYFKNLIIIFYLGFSVSTDTFFVSLGIIEFFLIVADIFDSIGVPNLVKSKDEAAFKKITAALLALTLCIAIVIVLLIFFSLIFIKIFISNNSHIDISEVGLYLLLLLPYLFATLIFHHFGAILRAQRRFTIFFLGEFIGLISVLVLLLGYFSHHDNNSALILPITLSIGQCISVIILLFFSREHIQVSFKWNEEMKAILKQFTQLLVVYSSSSISHIVYRIIGMLLPVKSITALTYGGMVAAVPKSIMRFENIFVVPLSEAKNIYSKIHLYSLFVFGVFSFIAIGIYFFSNSIVQLLFEYGRAEKIDMHLTALALQSYIIALPFNGVGVLYYRAFQILNKLHIIIPLGFVSSILVIILSVLFYKLNYGLVGLALAVSFTVIINTIVSFCILLVIQRKSHAASFLLK